MKVLCGLVFVLSASMAIVSQPVFSEEGGGGGRAQVSVNQLNDVSQMLMSGLQQNFETCARQVLGNSAGCTFGNMGTRRSPNATWGAKNSCHKNSPADAVDMGEVHCGGARMAPKDPNFALLAKCMANGSMTTVQNRNKSRLWRAMVAEAWNATGVFGGGGPLAPRMADMSSTALDGMLSARNLPFVKYAKNIMVASFYGGAGGGQANPNALRIIYGNGTESVGNLIGDPSGKHDDHIHAMVPGCSYNGAGGGPAKYDYKGNYADEGADPENDHG